MGSTETNTTTSLDLADRHVEAALIERVRDYPVRGRWIVVNPNTTSACVGEKPRTRIPPMTSTTLVDTVIESANSLLLLRLFDDDVSGILEDSGWRYNAELHTDGSDCGCTFPADIPLWRGPQSDAGTVSFDPCTLLGKEETRQNKRDFRIKANLWFAPSGTDCSIHKKHEFVEIHSQISGLGRMQKFREPDHGELYEDLPMSPGVTTLLPFFWDGDDETFLYPWHQYYADTDCVWLAVEYHVQRS